MWRKRRKATHHDQAAPHQPSLAPHRTLARLPRFVVFFVASFYRLLVTSLLVLPAPHLLYLCHRLRPVIPRTDTWVEFVRVDLVTVLCLLVLLVLLLALVRGLRKRLVAQRVRHATAPRRSPAWLTRKERTTTARVKTEMTPLTVHGRLSRACGSARAARDDPCTGW